MRVGNRAASACLLHAVVTYWHELLRSRGMRLCTASPWWLRAPGLHPQQHSGCGTHLTGISAPRRPRPFKLFRSSCVLWLMLYPSSAFASVCCLFPSSLPVTIPRKVHP